MAGIFRYNPCSSTPSRRSTLSPFCTSPGQLQDVTMDNSNVLGYRSPIPHAGTSSPGQGRSIREFEEQMASLRKENFNLKLRIYFLEEKIPGYSSSNPDGHESIMKQNIELKVEMEILRKELQEKQSLLGEAAKALELMEQSQKETEEKSQAIIDDLYQKIQYLEMENKELEKCTAANQIEQIMGRTDITGDVEAMRKVRELEGCVKNFEQQIEELSEKITELKTLVSEKNEKINELEDTIKQLKFQNAELAEQLDIKNKEIANAEMQNNESTKKLLQKTEDENSILLCENKNLLAMTKQLKIELEYEKHNSNEKDKKLKHQQKIMEEMQLTVLENMRHNTKQMKSISDYQITVDDLRTEKRKLQKENSSLKEIIIKLEHLKWRQSALREPEIYLGKTEASHKLSSRKNSIVPFSTCLQMANPLFHPKPHEKIDSNIGDSRYNSDYKLKEKFTTNMNKKKQSIPRPYADSRFYYREAKNYHNPYYGYLDANSDSQDLPMLPIKQGTAVNSATRAPLKECTRSNSEENLLPCGSLLKISKSDSSIYSSSSQQTIKFKNCHEEKLVGNNFEDALQFSEKPKYPKLKEELYDHKKQLADKLCLLDEIESKLKEKTSAHEKLCKVIQQLMLNTRNLEMENSRLKDMSTGQNGSQIKEDFYSNQSTGMSKTTNDPDAVFEIAILKSKLDKLTEEKNAEINKLKLEIKKKTANLQGLYENNIDDINSNESDDDFEELHRRLTSVLAVVRCAAHTIQLAAHDVIKTVETQVEECRKIAKMLRSIIRGNGYIENIQMPTLDNSTRWNSTYEMLNSLLKIKAVAEENERVPEINWEFIQNFIKAFKPLSECTQKFQKEQYIMGDFYRDWLSCEIELEEISKEHNIYAERLIISLKSRKESLLKNEAFIAAIYLDPRFNFLNTPFLNEEQKHIAVNLVNTELWEKNREIERLTKLLNKSNNSLPCSPVHEIDQLQLSFTDTEYYQALKRNKHLQEKVDTLIQKLVNVSDRNTDPIIQQLKSEINEAREEADKANRWRKDCAEFCAILTARLEELAGFLDSLLKQKDVLGALAADRRRAMRKAVDKSLDLSRSLNNNMTLSISGISLAEHSLAQLSNISGILDSSLENKENKVSLKDQTEIIENLKTEVKALKKELDRKRLTEYCKKERRSLPPLILDNQSESETWSEPDRNVSLQRIGLESSVCANQNKKEENVVTSSESGTDTNRKSKSKAHEKINQLEHIISQHENRILEAHCELLKNDDKLKEENQRFMEITQELEEYKKVNGMLEIEIANYKSHFDKILAEQENLKRNIQEKTSIVTKITEERDQLNIEVRVSELKIETLKTDIEEIKTKHEKELANIEEREREKLNNLQKEFLLKLEQKLKEQEEIQKEQINREARHIYDEAKRKLDETNKKLIEAQNTIDYLRENEVELNNSLIDKEKSMRNLKKNLDESTLQASKAVIERTKVLKEKLVLESKIQELISKLTVLEEEKSNLNVKMSQLENMNTLLHKKILNNSKNNYTTTKQMSDGSHSGYTSEEVPMAIRGATQRLENSSPDLGIESDAGRTSSVELSSAQAPLLKTIEIKGSLKEDAEGDKKLQSNEIDNNAVDEENNPQSCIISHDCAKVELENKELRRKLNRTKRAFEDTYKKLQEANQRKEQIERDIKHQILKTQNVLKNVRTNMETELEHNKKD